MPPHRPDRQAPSPSRRIGALLYDSVLLFGILALAVMLLIYPYELVLGHPYPTWTLPYRIFKGLYLLAVVCGFYLYFWTHGGQTLGMKTWRLRLVREDGAPVALSDALRRLTWGAAALAPAILWLAFGPRLGSGHLPGWAVAAIAAALASLTLGWCWIDREGLAWHDRRSGTRPIRVSP